MTPETSLPPFISVYETLANATQKHPDPQASFVSSFKLDSVNQKNAAKFNGGALAHRRRLNKPAKLFSAAKENHWVQN
jgi:hypothetical protein